MLPIFVTMHQYKFYIKFQTNISSSFLIREKVVLGIAWYYGIDRHLI